MNSWAQRHLTELEAAAGQPVLAAERVIKSARRRGHQHVPATGFILAVTATELVALRASPFLSRPRHVFARWRFDEGTTLVAAPLGRLRLVMPDRSVITLRPYGTRSVTHLAER